MDLLSKLNPFKKKQDVEPPIPEQKPPAPVPQQVFIASAGGDKVISGLEELVASGSVKNINKLTRLQNTLKFLKGEDIYDPDAEIQTEVKQAKDGLKYERREFIGLGADQKETKFISITIGDNLIVIPKPDEVDVEPKSQTSFTAFNKDGSGRVTTTSTITADGKREVSLDFSEDAKNIAMSLKDSSGNKLFDIKYDSQGHLCGFVSPELIEKHFGKEGKLQINDKDGRILDYDMEQGAFVDSDGKSVSKIKTVNGDQRAKDAAGWANVQAISKTLRSKGVYEGEEVGSSKPHAARGGDGIGVR